MGVLHNIVLDLRLWKLRLLDRVESCIVESCLVSSKLSTFESIYALELSVVISIMVRPSSSCDIWMLVSLFTRYILYYLFHKFVYVSDRG